jgi:hypothetical protein
VSDSLKDNLNRRNHDVAGRGMCGASMCMATYIAVRTAHCDVNDYYDYYDYLPCQQVPDCCTWPYPWLWLRRGRTPFVTS